MSTKMTVDPYQVAVYFDYFTSNGGTKIKVDEWVQKYTKHKLGLDHDKWVQK
jgi:hypothetical protein